jgi:secreted trypsin-like serine protease
MLRLLIIFSLLIIGNVNAQYQGDSCVKKIDDKPGVCEFLEDCPSAKLDFRRGIRPQICSFEGHRSLVCCAKETETVTVTKAPQPEQIDICRISVKKCEEYKKLVIKNSPFKKNSKIKLIECEVSTSLVVGGNTTKTGEFVHMAAIGYAKDFNQISFDCGGSLISEKFVLTAAHCINIKNRPPAVVRLGDQNLKSDDDGAEPQEFRVKRVIVHEGFTAKASYDDIGLIEMDREVKFTKFVRPACLWQDTNIPSESAIATGWGLLKTSGSRSEELQKVALTLMQNRDCQPYFAQFVKSNILNRGIVDGQLCAAAFEGGRLVRGKDTCQGDSGGPLQITLENNPCIHYAVGLTSFGIGCGSGNFPGIYTRVSEYIDWIEAKVWT